MNYQLGELEASLPAELFFRARREVLVNLSRIKEIKPYFKSGFLLVMADAAATEIVVSERQARSSASASPACSSGFGRCRPPAVTGSEPRQQIACDCKLLDTGIGNALVASEVCR